MGAPRDVGLLLNCASPRSQDPVGEGDIMYRSFVFSVTCLDSVLNSA